jgi:hypothetical protein
MEKKELILDIAKKLYHNHLTPEFATNLLLGISGDFISVGEQKPPHDIELLAKSPTGTVHLCSWRPSYNIFTCQDKSESSWDWSWKLI